MAVSSASSLCAGDGLCSALRFHWIEIVIYNSIQYIPMAILGFGLDEYFVYMFALFVILIINIKLH